MTLVVSAQRFDGNAWVDVALASDLAGVEASRTTFYGSPWVARLGLRILPQLRRGNVLVSGDELSELRSEAAALLSAIVGRDDEDYWRPRLRNIIGAVDAVIAYGTDGAVSIE